jgi:hypothetical protein
LLERRGSVIRPLRVHEGFTPERGTIRVSPVQAVLRRRGIAATIKQRLEGAVPLKAGSVVFVLQYLLKPKGERDGVPTQMTSTTPPSRQIRLTGTMDMIRYSTKAFALKLADGNEVHGVLDRN